MTLRGSACRRDWMLDVRAATEERYFEIAGHLPGEAAEALLEYAATGMLPATALRPPGASRPSFPGAPPAESMEFLLPRASLDPYAHPDALRRIWTIENAEDLERALELPWEKWSVILHPSQRAVVEREFSGPARVAGSTGTGKTVVALHRAARLAVADVDARVLLTTFSQPLANLLRRKLDVLIGKDASVVPRVSVTPYRGVAEEVYQLAFGRRPHVATDDVVRATSMDGLRLAHAVRDRWPPIKLIVTSGQMMVPESELPTGGRFFSKPYQPSELSRVLNELAA